jgi:hypothetical protein
MHRYIPRVRHSQTQEDAMLFSLRLVCCVCLFGSTSLAVSARAQSCLPLTPDGDALGYSVRAGSPRCEGFYQQPVAGTAGVRLVSLTYGRIAFNRDGHRDLRIAVAQPRTAPVRIRGELVPLTRFYRMDAELGPGQANLTIRLSDVIRPGQIFPDELGILAVRLRHGASEELIPVAIAADAAPMIEPGARLHLVLRPGIDLTNLRWRFRVAGQPAEFRTVPQAEGLVPAGTPLRFDADSPAVTNAVLDLRFFTLSGQELTDSIRLAFQ